MAIAGSAGRLEFTRRTMIGQVTGLPWALILLLVLMGVIGLATLYSATYTNPEEVGLPA